MRIASRLAITVGLALGVIALGAASAGAATFSNTTPIKISEFAVPASPYPSQITVSGQTAPITDLNVNLNGFSHNLAPEVGVVLVGPGGQALMLMSYIGGFTGTVNLKLDDSVGIQMPDGTGTLTSGTFRPTSHNLGPPLSFPSPGPLTSYGNPGPAGGGSATLASTFNGSAANGVWSLFVADFGPGDGGQFAGGWSLEVAPDPAKKKCKKGRKLKKGKCVKKKRKKKKKK